MPPSIFQSWVAWDFVQLCVERGRWFWLHNHICLEGGFCFCLWFCLEREGEKEVKVELDKRNLMVEFQFQEYKGSRLGETWFFIRVFIFYTRWFRRHVLIERLWWLSGIIFNILIHKIGLKSGIERILEWTEEFYLFWQYYFVGIVQDSVRENIRVVTNKVPNFTYWREFAVNLMRRFENGNRGANRLDVG